MKPGTTGHARSYRRPDAFTVAQKDVPRDRGVGVKRNVPDGIMWRGTPHFSSVAWRLHGQGGGIPSDPLHHVDYVLPVGWYCSTFSVAWCGGEAVCH